MTYTGFEADMERAAEKWTVCATAVNQGVRYVRAEADTGSNYVVVASPLPVRAQRDEGGPMLVTVLWPWQDAWVMASDGYVDASYVAEHLTGGRVFSNKLNGGDLQALTMTIRHALGRDEN